MRQGRMAPGLTDEEADRLARGERGRTARLTIGDGFCYASAPTTALALRFNGNDLARTGLRNAVPGGKSLAEARSQRSAAGRAARHSVACPVPSLRLHGGKCGVRALIDQEER